MNLRQQHTQRSHVRRGLSTLELVLALPLVLFVMALMVNFGTVACWKVRGLGVARNAVWSSRSARSSAASPRPDFWPTTAGASAGGAGNATTLDDQRVNQPVARGPLPGATVNVDLLDPTRGFREGLATLNRGFAMLAKLGPYQLRANTVLLDDRWQFGQMGLVGNNSLRIPVIYILQTAGGQYAQDYINAVVAIYYAPFRLALYPLDRDDEFIYYRGLFGLAISGTIPPDFHPRLNAFCSTDRTLADERVRELVDRIQGNKNLDPPVPSLAEDMANRFKRLYEETMAAYKSRINARPPPSPDQMAAMQAQINQLQQKIDVLNQFLQTLQ